MTKSFKKFLSLVLSILLIASTLVAGFSVSAAAPADSEAPYYDVDGQGVNATLVQYPHHLKPLDAPDNLDFEDGYRYWAGGLNKGTYGKTAFDIVTENGNSYAKIPATGYVSNFQTALIKLDNVTAGDNIVVLYDVKGAKGAGFRVKVEQEFVKSIAVFDEETGLVTTKKADGVSLINVTPGMPRVIVPTGRASSEFAVPLGGDGWTTLVSPWDNKLIAPVGSPADNGTADDIADEYYVKLMVTLGDAGVAAGDVVDAAIDNIRIAKVVDGVYYDAGTGDVIYDPANPPLVKKAPKNLDFSEGFSYWRGETAIYSVVDGVLKTNDTYASGSFRYLKSAAFNVYNAVEGSTVELSFDVDFEDGLPSMDGNANQQGTLNSEAGYKILDVFLADASINQDLDRINASQDANHALHDKVARDEVFYNEEGTVIVGPIAVEDPSQEFDFWIGCGNSAKKTWGISNITVTFTHPDGTVEVYPEPVDEPDVPVEPDEPEVPVEPIEPNPPKNLDFSDGFNYWRGEPTLYTVVDGVLKIDETTYTSGSFRWIKTEAFNIPNAVVGTVIKITFDVEFEDGLPSMDGNANQEGTLNSALGYKILDAFLADPTISDTDRYTACTEKNGQRKEIYYKDEGTVTVGPITITDPAQEFDFWLGCGNSAKKTWGVSNIVLTATHPDGTVDTYPAQPVKPELSADTLAWLMGLILANDVDDLSADFNDDKAVDLLDVVYVKKELARIAVVNTPIEGPLYATSTEDAYEFELVRYELHDQCKGYYFAPKAEGEYQTIIMIHGQGGAGSFKDTLVTNFNNWVKAGYIEPMVVVIPEVYDYEGNGLNINDFQYYMYASQTNRFSLMLDKVVSGELCSKIDTDKAPFVAGFSMGGMAAVQAGVEFRNKVKVVGGLSPSASFYLGDGNWGIYNNAVDIHFADDARVYLSAGLAEQNGVFIETINRFKNGISVNAPDIVTKFEAPTSWGGHSWPLCQKEIFMFLLFATQGGRMPTVELVEQVCNNPGQYTVPTIVTQ